MRRTRPLVITAGLRCTVGMSHPVWALGIRCALVALLGLWFGSASAADDITERAVPAPPQLRSAPVMPGAASSASGGAASGAVGGASAAGAAGSAAGGAAGGASAAGAASNMSGGAASGASAAGAAGGASGGAAFGGAAGAQVSIEQQMGFLQQRIMALESQIAILQSVLIVTPTGTTLQAPALLLQSLNGTTIESQKNVSLRAGQHLFVDTSGNLSMRTGAATNFQSGGTLDVKGSSIRLNGGTKPLATVGSQVQTSPGQPIGQVITGSPTILGN